MKPGACSEQLPRGGMSVTMNELQDGAIKEHADSAGRLPRETEVTKNLNK